MVDPASTLCWTRSIKGGNAAISKERSQYIAHHTTESMHDKDIVAKHILHGRRQMRCDGAHHTEYQRRWRANIARSRCNGNKSCHGTRAETNDRPLAVKAVVQHQQCDSTCTRGNVRHHHRLRGPKVSACARATVKTKPPKPDEHGAQNNARGVVRSSRQLHTARSVLVSKV